MCTRPTGTRPQQQRRANTAVPRGHRRPSTAAPRRRNPRNRRTQLAGANAIRGQNRRTGRAGSNSNNAAAVRQDPVRAANMPSQPTPEQPAPPQPAPEQPSTSAAAALAASLQRERDREANELNTFLSIVRNVAQQHLPPTNATVRNLVRRQRAINARQLRDAHVIQIRPGFSLAGLTVLGQPLPITPNLHLIDTMAAGDGQHVLPANAEHFMLTEPISTHHYMILVTMIPQDQLAVAAQEPRSNQHNPEDAAAD